MLIEIIIALILGLIAGIITGLIPGLHINLVAIFLISSSVFFLKYFSPIILAVFLVSMAITHTFLDSIPAIFLGAPNEDTALSVLPGHKLLLKGRGYEAVRLMTIGSFIGIFIILLITPIYIFFLPSIYIFLSKYMAYILIFISFLLIIRDEKKFLAFLIFILAGILGISSLNFQLISQPLFPLLSGLFGTSLLSLSIIKKTKIPKQNLKYYRINKKPIIKTAISSIIASSLVSFLPGLGPAQGAVIGSEMCGKLNLKSFLILLGTIGTATIGLGFVALYAILRPRHGVAVAISKLMENLTLNNLFLFLIIILISGSLAVFLTLFFARIFSKNINRLNYNYISGLIIIFIFGLSIWISGWLSLIVLITSTALGIYCQIKEVRKMHLMGVLQDVKIQKDLKIRHS